MNSISINILQIIAFILSLVFTNLIINRIPTEEKQKHITKISTIIIGLIVLSYMLSGLLVNIFKILPIGGIYMSKLLYTLLLVIITPMPCYAMTIIDLMQETVGVGKPGFAILLIGGCAIAAFILEQICKIIGKQNFAVLIGIVATFVATAIMIDSGLTIVNKLLAYF